MEELKLSIIIPTFNEEKYVRATLDSILSSALPDSVEILVYDGESTDQTRAILEEYSEKYAFLKLRNNPKRKQVYALNMAILEARGEYVVRCDAHSIYPENYFENLVSFLEGPHVLRYGNVGVAYQTVCLENGKLRSGIKDAMSHFFGVGGSHRTSGTIKHPSPVDTVLFGAWPRKVFEDVGLFDEDFERGQDFEHNQRLRAAGYQIAQIPGDKLTYFTRNSYRKLFKMIEQYAYVKGQLACLNRKPPNARSVVPALMPMLALALYAVSPTLLIAAIASYLILLGFFSLHNLAQYRSARRAIGFCSAIPLLHLAHAKGFYTGLFRTIVSNEKRNTMDCTR